MTEGIWISETEFLSFADKGSERSDLLSELDATGLIGGFDPLSWLGIMPDPDPVLQKTGDGIKVLRALTSDDKVLSCIQNRKLGTLKKKDFAFAPGAKKAQEPSPDAVRICAALESDLENIDLYNIMSQVLDAPYYGATFCEMIWEASGSGSGSGSGFGLRLKDIKPRPAEWFGFDANHMPVMRNKETEPVPFGKLVTARHFPDAVNPYGLRLLSRCLFPVAIKKGGIRFWAILCERFGIPWVIGKVNGDEKKRADALRQLTAMVQNAVAVVSEDTQVDIHTLDNKGGDIHSGLIRMCDTAIARVLHGQSITNEGGSTGTYAESKTSFDALGDFREADEHLIVTFWQEVAWIYTRLNAPKSTLSPTFAFIDPDDYEARANIDEKVSKTGVKFTKAYYTRNYGYKDDEIEVGTAGGAETSPSIPLRRGNKGDVSKDATTSDFSKENEDDEEPKDSGQTDSDQADSDKTDPDQIALDEMLDEIIPEAADAHGIAKALSEIINQAESFEDLHTRLEEALPELMGSEGMEEVLTRAMFAADLWGRFTISSANSPLPLGEGRGEGD